MSIQTFWGGIHPKYSKELTSNKQISPFAAPAQVVIPLQQHIGAPANAVVKKGDSVLAGQVIGEASHLVSANVHSPVSGTIVSVETRPHISGRSVMAVVIDNDQQERWVEMEAHLDPVQLSSEEINERTRAAGVVGMGGAAFPTSVKLNPPKGTKIDYLIINGAECEPYLTADHRLMLERTEDVILGAKLLAKAAQARQVIIGVEENKKDAIAALRAKAGSDAIKVVTLGTKYPQGGEKQLIKALTGREVPRNGLPFQAGIVVQNVGTAVAVVEAVRDGKPLVSRVVTVTGSIVKEPGNFLVPIGTPIGALIEAAGGCAEEIGKVLVGGPMMGMAQVDLDAPVIKGVSGILVLARSESQSIDPMPCIKCARCVDVCPAYLMPLRLEAYSMNALWDEAEEFGAMDCIECGCCTYICPSKRALLHWIRLGKNQITAAKRRQKS